MPWTVKDVDKHKKGLTPAQKKKWVKIANGVLADCKKKGGKNCEGKAIKVANSKFSDEVIKMSKSKTNKVPKGALRLVDVGEVKCVFAPVGEAGKIPKLQMVAYTGGIIKNHWWWGNLAIDLNGMVFLSKKFPILENHMTDMKIAYTGKPRITEKYQLEINPETTRFVDTEESNEFRKLSAEGFPYQASIYARPMEIKRLGEKETDEVNGYTIKGPATIWKKSEFKEASICVFGWDSKTSSSAFSRKEMEEIDCDCEVESTQFTNLTEGAVDDNNTNKLEGGEERMDLAQFKKDHPEIAAQFKQEVTNEVTASVTESVTATVTEELTKKFSTEKDALTTKLSNQSDQIAQLQKNDAIRTERELKLQAQNIFDAKLAESDVSDHLHDKVKAMVRHSKFVKDGILDIEKFTEAVDAEIQDWEDRGATSQVLGAGRTSRSETGDHHDHVPGSGKLSDQDRSNVNMLLERAGQPQQT